jgi:hypothetical protein
VESGIIYFFTRARVNTEHPQSVKDIQRSFFVLRPISQDETLENALKKDPQSNRLFALPKKVFPRRSQDRAMAFVEKGQVSINELKKSFLPGSEHDTKTRGVQYQPPALPVAEGVYSITTVGRTSFLTYMLTIPEQLDEVQSDLGLQESGSFIISVKNPERPGPASVRLSQSPKYPKEYGIASIEPR